MYQNNKVSLSLKHFFYFQGIQDNLQYRVGGEVEILVIGISKLLGNMFKMF